MSGKPIDAEDIAVLLRLQAALPNVGLNGWFEGVRVLARVIEHLTAAQQQPVGMVEAFEEYHKADHRDPAVAPEWEWWQAAWKAALAQQPAAVGEEIMVNAAHDVFTLPLQPSGLSSGPRFVVHVPGPEQPAAVDEAMVFRLAVWMAKQDGHDDPHHLIWEGSPPEPWGEIWMRYEDDARSALTAALAAQHQEPKS